MLGSRLLLTASCCTHPWREGKGSKPQRHRTRAGDISAGRMLRSFPHKSPISLPHCCLLWPCVGHTWLRQWPPVLPD